MEEIYNMANDLADKMRETTCYKNYVLYKDNIENNLELKNKIIRFKKNQFEIESRKAQGFQIAFGEEISLGEEYNKIMLDENGAGFITSEREVIKMISQVYESIGSRVCIDLSFLE